MSLTKEYKKWIGPLIIAYIAILLINALKDKTVTISYGDITFIGPALAAILLGYGYFWYRNKK